MMKGEIVMRDRDIMPIRRRRGEPMSYEGLEDTFNKYVDSFVGYMDNFFNRDIQGAFGAGIKADIRETEREYVIEAEMPGFNREDIGVELVDDRLTISANREDRTDEEGRDYIRRERRYGSVKRSFSVQGIRPEEVRAEYRDGILHIILPKNEETIKRGRNIEIK